MTAGRLNGARRWGTCVLLGLITFFGLASVRLDGTTVSKIESIGRLSGWTTIGPVDGRHLEIDYCGEAGGFFMFQRE